VDRRSDPYSVSTCLPISVEPKLGQVLELVRYLPAGAKAMDRGRLERKQMLLARAKASLRNKSKTCEEPQK